MSSSVFGPKEDDDYDVLFNLDDVEPQYNIQDSRAVVNNRQIAPKEIEPIWTLEAACDTPKCDVYTNNSNPQMFDTSLENVFSSTNCDSAVGTFTKNSVVSMQSSPMLLNGMTNQNCEGQGSSIWMAQEVGSQFFLSTQDEMFSQDFVIPSTHSTNACVLQSTNNDRHSSSFNSALATELRPTNTSLANHSWFSLMQRSLMKENIRFPSTSCQLTRTTQEQDNLCQDETFSSFFKAPAIPGDDRSALQNNLNPSNSFQEIPYLTSQYLLTGSIEDSCRRVMENQQHSQSQRSPPEGIFTGRSMEDFYRRIMENQHYSQSQRAPLESLLTGRSIDQNTNEKAYSLPQSIIDLYEQIKSTGLSDWSFVYALSAQTCQEFMPMNFNVTLKTSLLLSIASIDTVSLAVI